MVSKHDVQSLVKRIINEAKVRNQEAVSEGAGYKKKTLSQRISNGEDLDAVYNQLLLVYGHRLKKSTTPEPTTIKVDINQGLIETLIQKLIVVSETTNGLLKQQQKDIVDKVKKIDTNLEKVRVGIDTLQLEVSSDREVSLRSLARLEGKQEDAHLKEAGNIMKKRGGTVGKKNIPA